VTLTGFSAVIATLTLTATSVAGAAIALFVWSVFTWAFNPPIQNLLLEMGEGGGLLLAMNASAIYLGAGLSAVVGGVVIKLVGVQLLPPIAGALGLVVIGLLVVLRRNPALQQVEHLEPAEEELIAVAD